VVLASVLEFGLYFFPSDARRHLAGDLAVRVTPFTSITRLDFIYISATKSSVLHLSKFIPLK